MQKQIIYNRELSWLSFNHRVLQEAGDKEVPLYERIKFMAIFSSNLDEYYRVRVASLRYLLELKRKYLEKLDFDPVNLLKDIHKKVHEQQEKLGDIFRNQILNELENENIFLLNESNLNVEQIKFAENYFQSEIMPYIQAGMLASSRINYFLKNKSIYFVVRLVSKMAIQTESAKKSYKYKHAIFEIPTQFLSRFVVLPEKNNKKYLIFIDDIIRLNMASIFPGYSVESAHSIKLTRDAEMYIDDEFSGSLLTKIKEGIVKRKSGVPSRFLYDNAMPKEMLKFLKSTFGLQNEDLVPGGKYHNFNDFFSLPMLGSKNLCYKNMPPIKSKLFESNKNKFGVIEKQDVLLHYPYHCYDYIVELLQQAAIDSTVSAIWITLYRVSSDSKIVQSLIQAAKKGKSVFVFVEIKARFDEESNIYWATELENAGINVRYSFPGLKVHSKICLIERENKDIAYLSTGNFNEQTAKIYTDLGYFTSKRNITDELKKVFAYLAGKKISTNFKNLLVSPFNMRTTFETMINNEIKNAQKGKDAKIILKLNSLQDAKMIKRLYAASQAGVKIKLIVRGVCCLIPGIKGLSENIEAISIVDRYLEHSRIYIFHNDGNEKYYVASADWMKRNLSRRIEVGFPIEDENLIDMIEKITDLQWQDNKKARIIGVNQNNEYRSTDDKKSIQSQNEIYKYLKLLETKN
jgi:polyphosphate kinase